MKTVLIVTLLLTSSISAISQQFLFEEVSVGNARLSVDDQKRYTTFLAMKMVNTIKIVKINSDKFKEPRFNMYVNGKSIMAERTSLERNSKSVFSWFGKLSDETGIFFTVMGNKIASKFYVDNDPYSLLPLNDTYHVLILYNKNIDQGICKTTGKVAKNLNPGTQQTETSLDENPCNLRVLLVVTNTAEAEIPIPLELAARMLEDESNLAYQQSQINYRMEIARVVRTTYAETTNWQSSSEYGSTDNYPIDLLNLRSGGGLLTNIPTLRNTYSADVVVMVRTDATSSAQGFYGIALGVPTFPWQPQANNAFALISTAYMIGGRFTFAHEIGHIQGARHDTHSATPTYARGYVFSTATSNNRTIMAVGCATPGTGCRVQFFSNPNVTLGGIPVGVANQYDNARRINETASDVLGFRLYSTSLLLAAETFDAEILARHVAMTNISTNNNNVIAMSQSRVSFRAGTEVRMLPGFEARSGSEFVAYLDSCASGAASRLSQPELPSPITSSTIKSFDHLSINEVEELTLFPNPTTSSVTISYNAAIFKNPAISILDQSGRLVYKFPTMSKSNIQTLDLSTFSNGVYFIEIKNVRTVIYKKIVLLK